MIKKSHHIRPAYINLIFISLFSLVSGGLLREADPELMEQVLKVCIDGETSGSPSASTSAPESGEDEFSDDNNDEETDDLSEVL